MMSGLYIFATSQLFPHSQLQWYFAKIISEGACFDKFKVLASHSLRKGSLPRTTSIAAYVRQDTKLFLASTPTSALLHSNSLASALHRFSSHLHVWNVNLTNVDIHVCVCVYWIFVAAFAVSTILYLKNAYGDLQLRYESHGQRSVVGASFYGANSVTAVLVWCIRISLCALHSLIYLYQSYSKKCTNAEHAVGSLVHWKMWKQSDVYL